MGTWEHRAILEGNKDPPGRPSNIIFKSFLFCIRKELNLISAAVFYFAILTNVQAVSVSSKCRPWDSSPHTYFCSYRSAGGWDGSSRMHTHCSHYIAYQVYQSTEKEGKK